MTMSTAEKFRSLLGESATDRTINLAASAVDLLTEAGASEEVIGFVIDAIAAWESDQYEQRRPAIEDLKAAGSRAPKPER